MKQTQINLNEEWAISSDELNLILRKRQRNKKTNELSDNYTNVGYYTWLEEVKEIPSDVVKYLKLLKGN